MKSLSRRDFLVSASAATLAATAFPSLGQTRRQRVFVASNTPNGILAFDWDPSTADLTPVGVAANINNVDWIIASADRKTVFAAAEVNSFNGKPTGEVASFALENGKLASLSAQNSASTGTCHICLDHTGHVLLAADYFGGSAVSFLVKEAKLTPLVWSEHYTEHGPDPVRQPTAHAHFASVSPNSRFAYFNDLGGDSIHIYRLNAVTGILTPAGIYRTKPGSGPRTLHFHPNGHSAYSINEMGGTVDVLEWNKATGLLTMVTRIDLLPEGFKGGGHACDTVITKDGRFVYFTNREYDFIYGFKADFKTGALTPIARFNCGGPIPRNFVLDPTERWMLVANQTSNHISIFARDPETGKLADKGKTVPAATPMCILFV